MNILLYSLHNYTVIYFYDIAFFKICLNYSGQIRFLYSANSYAYYIIKNKQIIIIHIFLFLIFKKKQCKLQLVTNSFNLFFCND